MADGWHAGRAVNGNIVYECIDDLRRIDFSDAGASGGDEVAESLVHRFLPTRFRHDYDEAFFRKVLVTAVKVAQDLADPVGRAAACTA
ncbi:hypothetical protein [Saccharothrix syringae]|uniref:Uncharacterized protein n=1 Tax=Saccharothrix syringae TaxID=103733 RepID=A0A5Q0H2A0_SACSY|nr:hypothetical protein [Saccharothrix syringae]QFZ20377.1 hypothetical protein EKG83_25795 [Saccharothrix syringae]